MFQKQQKTVPKKHCFPWNGFSLGSESKTIRNERGEEDGEEKKNIQTQKQES